MNTRTGKIARLPQSLRDQLNCRMQDGETGPQLAQWLNTLEPVQLMLAQQFDGRPITEQNLSEWRQGGHQDWLRREEAKAMALALLEEAESLGQTAGGEAFTEKLALVLAAELAGRTQRMLAETGDPDKRWTQLQALLRELSRLRRDNHQAAREADRRARTRIQQERWERAKAREDRERKAQEAEERRKRYDQTSASLQFLDLMAKDQKWTRERLLAEASHEELVRGLPLGSLRQQYDGSLDAMVELVVAAEKARENPAKSK